MLENVQPPPAQIRHTSSSFLTGSTIRAVHGDTSYQTYDDFRDSVLAPPAALTTQNPKSIPSGALAEQPAPYLSHHRRANTEVLTRQSVLLANQSVGQSNSFQDPRHKDNTYCENSTKRKLELGGRILVDWFQGKSDSVNLGVYMSPPKQTSTNMSSDLAQEKGHLRQLSESALPMNRLHRISAPSPLKQVASPGRFSFFGSKKQGDKTLVLPEPADDEFLNLDINAALFPPRLSNGDPQEALECLKANAEDVLRRLQATYKERTFALHQVLAQKMEQEEELEEARTRVQHTKIQLDDMAERVLEKDKALKTVTEELEQEREARQREDEARRRSVSLKPSDNEDGLSDLGADLRTPRRQSKRASAATFATSDSGFESGDESTAESIFSRENECLNSPVSTFACSSPSASQITLPMSLTAAVQAPPKEAKPLPAPPRTSAYDRVITGLAGAFTGGNNSKCTNCHGIPSSEAWSVVGILKEENKGLKGRIGELETVIDDCLNLVGP
ncbi:hypothetical protein DTO166G4_6262 [Paecilomyces variotii]|uniref:Uncharacterized protein n=1 Tax=Byssochlamys spectabilis TaxID=264951 RepID=A0A443HWJ4_BYSSP|nr:hypothetical protein C8Q69DRAFT_506331 [Paecilomyces variotii]KAJ9196036.1 hypothetical protein DTO032I3_6520 [Paecilomyces variotii]KAJ9212106.1 hypothetical protein DTO166G4_6262 [Paecilomyces variotii]KAJ9239923.1 hypothetical protein DTO166G5_2190 [Paecilomyces variotii]KAJ9279663.1 hypothetical protein DTO021D3_3454 [Paecilomyces variotii]KAJ9310087.1 hypothetical protein DTO217A2_373 [Paecilomyces variotii]